MGLQLPHGGSVCPIGQVPLVRVRTAIEYEYDKFVMRQLELDRASLDEEFEDLVNAIFDRLFT